MKKILFCAAIVAATLTSCSKDEAISNAAVETMQPLTFGTYVNGVSTKGTSKSSFESGDSFGVFAFYTASSDYDGSGKPNFMYNEDIVATETTDGVVWSYSPIKYWPHSTNTAGDPGQISFFAYWPMASDDNGVAISESTATGDPVITYTIDSENLIDLMWGVSQDGTPHLDKTYNNVTDKLTFQFKHALARVGFLFKLSEDIFDTDDVTKITINSVEFGGSIDGETFSPALTKTADLTLNNTTASEPVWSNPSGTTMLTIDDASDFTDGKNSFSKGDESPYVTSSADGYLMIIPQDLSDYSLRLKCTVETTDSSLCDGTSSVEHVYTYNLQDFLGGKAYTYTVTMTIEGIEIEGVLSNWVDDGGRVLNEPITL